VSFRPHPDRAEDRKRRGSAPADSWLDRNLAERCLTRGAPKLPGGYNNNFQIVQSPGYVMILHEMIHEARIIPLDNRPHYRSEHSPVDGRFARPWNAPAMKATTRAARYSGRSAR
jgi:hypothetical protein